MASPSILRDRHSEAVGEFGERDPDTIVDGQIDGELVVTAAQVLHERVPDSDGAQRGDRLRAAPTANDRVTADALGYVSG